MNKRLIPWYLLVFFLVFACTGTYVVYECWRHGLQLGLFVTLLSWSIYVLSVPAAHGRLFAGSFSKFFTGRSFFPEPYLWTFAAALNIVVLFLSPQLYTETLITYIFYRSLFNPSYWIIFILAAAGTWYRTIIGQDAYASKKATHTAIRHLITLAGLLVLFYLTHQDFIVLLNATVSG